MHSTMGIAVTGVAVAVLATALLGRAQYTPSGGGAGAPLSAQSSRQQGPLADGLAPDLAWDAKRLRALNADRQKSMISDAEKLVKLARQLDAEVASNPRDELTPSELHKLAEIEKLARNIKSKMAMSFTGSPEFHGITFGPDAPRE
jgi:hypothetical protein